MKCKACGYENEFDWEKNTYSGDEDFIQIEGGFTITVNNGYGNHLSKVNLLACPKCHTVIMHDLW